MQRTICRLALIIAILSISSMASAHASEILYSANSNLLSVNAQSAPLSTLLAEISQQTNLRIVVDRSVDKPITIRFKDKPLEQALAYLLKGMNVLSLYADHRVSNHKTSLLALHVLPDGADNHDVLKQNYPNASNPAPTYVSTNTETARPAFIESNWESQLDNFSPDVKTTVRIAMQRAKSADLHSQQEQENLQNAIQKQLFEYAVASQMLEEALQGMNASNR